METRNSSCREGALLLASVACRRKFLKLLLLLQGILLQPVIVYKVKRARWIFKRRGREKTVWMVAKVVIDVPPKSLVSSQGVEKTVEKPKVPVLNILNAEL
jgi:uncharacterized Tic20 family protein